MSRWATTDELRVLDLGGRDVNGTCRDLFPNAEYLVLDLRDGPNVDIIGDAATYKSDDPFDLVLCTEVLEHEARWHDICLAIRSALRDGGRVVITCAGPGRGAHSAVYEGPLLDGEYYCNVDPEQLRDHLESLGFREIVAQQVGLDTQATAVR